MPTYVYACTACGERLEAVQRITDDPLTICPACEGSLRKVIQPVGIVFKGSGFYKTDSRNGSKPAAESSKSTESTGSGESGKSNDKSTDSKSSDSTATKPAASTSSGDSKPAAKPAKSGGEKVA